MFGRQVSVKDDSTDYIIYYPHPLTFLPPVSLDIPETGCQILSIDPAIKNLAIRLEKRYSTGYVETLYMERLNLSDYGDTSDTGGTTKVDPQILTILTQFLTALLPHLRETRIVAVERQLAVNYKSSRIYQHILTFFMIHAPTFQHPCIVMDIDPKLKGKILGAPKGLNKYGLKQWAIEKALEILTIRGDQRAIKCITDNRGKSKTKADDLSDTVIQIEAWFILVGGVHTTPPIELTLGQV